MHMEFDLLPMGRNTANRQGTADRSLLSPVARWIRSAVRIPTTALALVLSSRQPPIQSLDFADPMNEVVLTIGRLAVDRPTRPEAGYFESLLDARYLP